jgi:hypothetical protein
MPDQPEKPNPASRLPRHVPRTPGDWGRGHLKVDNLLKEEDRDAYFALLRQPGTTCRKALHWLRARGYRVGPGAVKHHKRRFNEKLQQVKTSAEMSLVCAELVRQVGAHRMSDAAVLRFETLLTEALFKRGQGEALAKPEWEMLGRALTTAVLNRSRVETVRMADEAAKREAGQDPRSNRKRLDGVTISDKVRKILGVPLPGEPLPALPPPALPPPVDAPPAEAPPPPAPEGRQTLAHDASRGETSGPETSPGGA